MSDRDLAEKLRVAQVAAPSTTFRRGRRTIRVSGRVLPLSKLTDAIVSEGRARGWLEIRSGDVVLTSTGEDALRVDYRTAEEKAAALRPVPLDAGFLQDLRDIAKIIVRSTKEG